MALAGLAFACAQCCRELRTPPPQPATRCVDCDSKDPVGNWCLGLDGRRLCNTHSTQESRPEGYRLARAQLIVAKAGGLTGEMPCYTAPYADRSHLNAVMACLPGGSDDNDPLFAAVPWSVLAGPVLAAVNALRRGSDLPPWEDFPTCGPATAHYLDPLQGALPASRIAAFGIETRGRSHDARRHNHQLMRPSQRHTRKRKTFSMPRPRPSASPERAAAAGRDGMDGSDPDDDPLAYSVTDQPNHGTVAVDPVGTFTYTADPELAAAGGTDTFVVEVRDTGFHLNFWVPTAISVPVTVTVQAAAPDPVEPDPVHPPSLTIADRSVAEGDGASRGGARL